MTKFERTRSWSAGAWVKSSRSYAAGECVEASAVDGGVQVRDSKQPHGPQLRFTRAEWAAFLAGVRNGEFDHLC